jgi:hypothetical protein
MRAKKVIDYFKPAATAEEEILRRIKGNYRRDFVSRFRRQSRSKNNLLAFLAHAEGLDPEGWKAHNIPERLKGVLGQQNPRFRGGEDLPDLEDGEVEIARLTLANSVHGEVTSLRATQAKQSGKISLRMVDEYESEITLPYHFADIPLSSEQVVCLFREAEPSPTKFGCEIEFQSFFHPDLNKVAEQLRVK